MRSSVIVNAIARSGGFFFSGLLEKNERIKFLQHLRRNDLADIVTRSLMSDFGYLLKLKDELIVKHYPYDARKREFYQTHSNPEKQRSSRFHVSDFKLYHSFVKFSVWRKFYYSVIPKNEEAVFFQNHEVQDHIVVGKSICYAYDYSNKKIVVIVMDFDKSLKNIFRIIEFYNSPEFKIIIATLKPADMFETDLYKMINSRRYEFDFILKTDIEVVNFPKIDKFFGV